MSLQTSKLNSNIHLDKRTETRLLIIALMLVLLSAFISMSKASFKAFKPEDLAQQFLSTGAKTYKAGSISGGAAESKTRQYISALGRIEPHGEIIRINPPAFAAGERVESVYVKNGQYVNRGQIIARMDNFMRLNASFIQAQKETELCSCKLERVLAGASKSEILAKKASISKVEADAEGKLKTQEARINRLKSEATLAQNEQKRYAKLYAEGAVSESEADLKRTRLETALALLQEASDEKQRIEATYKSAIEEAKSTLSRIAEVRAEDIACARAELEKAKAAERLIKTDLDFASINAPVSGRILKVYAHPGESAGTNGIAEIAQTGQMYCVAEVFESDLKLLKKGQKAAVYSQALTQELVGSVFEIGSKVSKQNIYSSEPGSDFDDRVIEVKILMAPDSSRQLEKLSNLQVTVRIAV